jgi:hypothetical protein
MKAFANITLGELNEARYEMRRVMHGCSANLVPDMVNWEAVAEYIFEMWGNEYDNDDIDLVYEELCIGPDAKKLYVLEVQEAEDGTEFLYIEVIVNGR